MKISNILVSSFIFVLFFVLNMAEKLCSRRNRVLVYQQLPPNRNIFIKISNILVSSFVVVLFLWL